MANPRQIFRKSADSSQTGGVGHAVALGGLGQLVSSASNLVVVVAAANVLAIDNFGRFGLLYASVFFLLGLARSVGCEPLLSRSGGLSPRALLRAHISVAGWVISLHAVAAGAVAAIAGGGTITACAAVAGGAILFCLDYLKHLAFAFRRPGVALVGEVLWAIALLAALFWARPTTVAGFLGCWLLTALPGAVAVGVASVRPVEGNGERPAPLSAATRSEVKGSLLSAGYRLGAEYLLTSGSGYLGIVLVRLAAGVAAVGAVRGVVTLFAPVNILLTTMMSALVPVLVPRGVTAPDSMGSWARRRAAAVSLGLVSVAAVFTLVWLAVPSALGRRVLGETWLASRGLVPVMGLALVFGSLANGPLVLLRALSQSQRSLATRVRSAAVAAPVLAIAAFSGGASGYCAGLAASNASNSVIWWWAISPRQLGGSIRH